MADEVKELLARWTVDSSGFDSAIKAYRATLQQIQAEEKVRADADKAASKAAIDALNQQIAAKKLALAADKEASAQQKNNIDAVAAERKAQEALGAEIIALQKRADAAARASEKAKMQAIAAERKAQEELGRQIIAIQKRQEEASKGEGEHGDGINNARKVKDTVDALMGRMTVGPIDVLLTKIPLLQSALSVAFPVVGIGLFVGMLTEGISKFNEFTKELKELPDTIRDSWGESNTSLDKTNEELRLADDNIKNAIARLEHKPVNNLAIALDEARIKADDLYTSAIAAGKELKKLLEDSKVSLTQRIFSGLQGTDQEGLDQGVIDEFNKKARAATNASRDVQKAAKNPDLNLPENDARRIAAQQKLNELYQIYVDKQKEGAKLAADELAKRKPQTYQEYVTGASGYGQVVTRTRNTNQDTVAINTLQALQDRFEDLAEKPGLENNKESDEKRQKDLEERKRQSEEAMQRAQAALQAKKANNSEALENAKLTIQQEQELNTQMYASGKEKAEDYYATKKALAVDTFKATRQEIEANRQADLQLAALDNKNGKFRGNEYNDRISSINANADRQGGIAFGELNKSTFDTNQEQSAAATQAQLKNIDIATDAVKKGLDSQIEATKYAYQQESISADEYIKKTIDLINESVTVTEVAEATKAEYTKQSAEEQAASIGRVQQATENALKQITQLQQQALQLRLNDASSNYNDVKNNTQALAQFYNNPSSGATDAEKIANQQTLLDATNKYRETLVQALAVSQDQPKVFQETYLKLLQMNEASQQLANTIKDMSSYGGQFFSTLGAGSSALSGLFTSKYARGVERSITGGVAAYSSAEDQVENVKTGFGNISSSNDTQTNIDNFTQGLKGAVSALGGFINSVSQAGSASAGALGGGISGAGLGQQIGSATSSITGLGSLGGPIGMAIGAGLGAALGGVFGQKQEEAQDDITQLTYNFKGIMDAYQSNNASLNQTILSLQSLIAEAQAEEASTKKDGSQFKDLINQYNQQIIALENQQAQIMTQLNTQLIQISSPEAYQPLIGSIEQIVQQYTTFVGAAQNATELAQANDYLTQSLQNLATSYSETLNQDQVTAVQDALQLNQLYNQRNQLEQQYLQQVESIQGQGTLTRTITSAQSKFSQLYDLDVNQANQLDSINQQIALTQYQVQAYSQIFQMATTKAGLETQLLSLQEVGINLDMNRIVAMENVLALLQQTGYSIVGNLATLNTSDPNALLTLILQILAQQLGVNVGGANNPTGGSSGSSSSNGNSVLDSLAAGAYAERSSYGYATFRGTNL